MGAADGVAVKISGAFKITEEKWREVPPLKKTESPEYAGRAVAALAQDKRVLRRSGNAYMTGELAREYGFTDIDCRRPAPFRVTSFEKILAHMSTHSCVRMLSGAGDL